MDQKEQHMEAVKEKERMERCRKKVARRMVGLLNNKQFHSDPLGNFM